MTKQAIPQCSICFGPLYEPGAKYKDGCNAEPINDGRCCQKCDAIVVLARIRLYKQLYKQEK